MRDERNREDINSRLKQAEQIVVIRLKQIGDRLKQSYSPENMGMILAAEGVEARFSLGSSIVKAVWNAELTDDQLKTITAKLESKNRLIAASEKDLKEDILVLGRLLSRIQIDQKELFANDPELKLSLMTSLLKSIEVILTEYEKERTGEARSISVRDFFENSIVIAIRNVNHLVKTDPHLDKNEIKLAVDRYQDLLDVVRKIDPRLQLERKAILQLRDGFHSILSVSLVDKMEIEGASDEVFDRVLEAFKRLK